MENFNPFKNSTSEFDYGESSETFDSSVVWFANQSGSELNCTDYEDKAGTNGVEFIFHGMGIIFLALFGIPANILSLIVLQHPKMKSSLTTLLLGLTISDIFVIAITFLLFAFQAIFKYLKIFSWYNVILLPAVLPRLFPILCIAFMSSAYFTVVVTLERYIAVCLPLKARSFCTQTTARNSAIAVIILSILYNIPRWIEYETIEVKPNCTGNIRYTVNKTETGFNKDYRLYYANLSNLIVNFFIPFSILLFFNITIYFEVKKQQRNRNSLSSCTTNSQSSSNSEDLTLAGMLFGIVITFFACNMLSLVLILMDTFDIEYSKDLGAISDFLTTFGCSTNFVFYCLFGNKFRSQLAKTLGISELSINNTKDASSDNKIRMHSNAPTTINSDWKLVESTSSNGNGSAKVQPSCINAMNDTKPNAVENHADEVSCSQITVTTFLSD